MFTHLLAILGLGVACGLWIVVQRWIASQDPEQPGVEGSKGCGAKGCELPESACAGCLDRDGCASGAPDSTRVPPS
jgi:hypothetical protein